MWCDVAIPTYWHGQVLVPKGWWGEVLWSGFAGCSHELCWKRRLGGISWGCGSCSEVSLARALGLYLVKNLTAMAEQKMHALHDIGIIHGNWVGTKWPQRDYIKINVFWQMISGSHTFLSNSESKILLVLPWARWLLFTCWCLPSLRHWWQVLLLCLVTWEMQWDCGLGLARLTSWRAADQSIHSQDRHIGFVPGQYRREKWCHLKYLFFPRWFIDEGKVLWVKSS